MTDRYRTRAGHAKKPVNRRAVLTGIGAAGLASGLRLATASAEPLDLRPRALVYRGPAASPGSAEAVAALLSTSRTPLRVEFVGPRERLQLTPAAFGGAVVYAQAGGGDLADAWPHVAGFRDPLRAWISAGGRYLGFCLGAYLAGATPGFGLLPGDTYRWISAPTATVHAPVETTIDVRWRGRPAHLFFQDGPGFALHPGAPVTMLATYPDGSPAAFTAPFGLGRVGVVGPHPEADQSWFGNRRTDAIRPDLGHDLVESTLYALP